MTKYIGGRESRRAPCGHHILTEATVNGYADGKHSWRCKTCKTYWVITIEPALLNGQFADTNLRKITWGTK